MVALTGHHVIAAGVDPDEARRQFDPDDIAAPFSPSFLAWLAHRLNARTGHIDATLARLGAGGGDDWLRSVEMPPDNERVRRARRLRSDVVFLEPREGGAVVTLGTGLAGRREISMEISEEADRSAGFGTRLVTAALRWVPDDQAVFAGVAPGNARSLRCLLSSGFRPIGAECFLSARP